MLPHSWIIKITGNVLLFAERPKICVNAFEKKVNLNLGRNTSGKVTNTAFFLTSSSARK